MNPAANATVSIDAPPSERGRAWRRVPTSRYIDWPAVRAWVLAGGLVLYLAADGGGYDTVVHSQVGIVVWWIVLLGVAAGVLPRARLTRWAWAALALFAGFVVWTAISSFWSLSVERTLADTSLIVGYLGILALGVAIHRDRGVAMRHTGHAIGAVVAFVGALAVASRVFPGLFPIARETYLLLPGVQRRLAWPLNYWNALAALMALGLPLLLATATSARTIAGRALAAAVLPVLALCAYLTFSRGGAIAIAVALVAFFILTSERIPKIATALVAAAGSAILIAAASQRSAIENGLTNGAARHEGATLVVLIVLVCAAVALAQVAIVLLIRRLEQSRGLAVPRTPAVIMLVAGIVAVVVAAALAGAPGRISRAWRDFKHPGGTALSQNSLARFGSANGNGRYQAWQVALHYAGHHPLNGGGAGTFQLIWLPRATLPSYLINAHSLYFETFAELGVIGLVLLLAFLLLALWRAVACVTRASRNRAYAAGVAAALITFCVSAFYDWNWQVPVLPAAFMLLAAAVLAPRSVRARPRSRNPKAQGEPPARAAQSRAAADRTAADRTAADRTSPGARPKYPLAIRAGLVLAALAAVIAIAVPLATTSALRKSQAAVSAGNLTQALAAARTTVRLESGSASGALQLALVLELRHQLPSALAAAKQASRDEPQNWSTWLVLSRLQAENGHAHAAVAAYRRARALNPRSPLFAHLATNAARSPSP